MPLFCGNILALLTVFWKFKKDQVDKWVENGGTGDQEGDSG